MSRLGVTVGDPAGIGPEVVSVALRTLSSAGGTFRVYGDISVVERAGGLPDQVELEDTASASATPGNPDPATASGVIEAIRRAARDCLSGELDAMVTGPISKQVIGDAGFPYPGHTELLQQATTEILGHGCGRAVMLLVGGSLRVGLATVHCALRDVPAMLTREGIAEVLRVMHRDLSERFGLDAPRIAVCGLNPHAGEGGRFGDEEKTIIAPAVALSRASGIAASGPICRRQPLPPRDKGRVRCRARAPPSSLSRGFIRDGTWGVSVRRIESEEPSTRAEIGARAGPIWHYAALRGTRSTPTCSGGGLCPLFRRGVHSWV